MYFPKESVDEKVFSSKRRVVSFFPLAVLSEVRSRVTEVAPSSFIAAAKAPISKVIFSVPSAGMVGRGAPPYTFVRSTFPVRGSMAGARLVVRESAVQSVRSETP